MKIYRWRCPYCTYESDSYKSRKDAEFDKARHTNICRTLLEQECVKFGLDGRTYRALGGYVTSKPPIEEV